jgi:2-oxoglutarate ferredoxin oxidoreductase subunit gamma
MLIKTVFAGFGGQGVLSMGLNLAQAAMLEGKHVTYLPSYGAEVRGGTANCTVAISDEEIASPVASSPEFVVVMNQPSLVRFQNQLESGGVLLVNSSLVKAEISRGDVDIVRVPAASMAEELGNAKCANMVMLGSLINHTKAVAMESVVKTLIKVFPRAKKEMLQINERALSQGAAF